MSFEGLATPTAQHGEDGPVVLFDDGTHIPCGSMIEAEALAEAWRRWPRSEHRPVEEARSRWRTGFADGAQWAANRRIAQERDYA